MGRWNFFRQDLRWRLLGLSMLPLVVFAVAWGSFVVYQRYIDLNAQLQQRAQLLARQLAAAADYGVFSQNTGALQNLTSSVLRESSVTAAAIYGPDFEPLAARQLEEKVDPARIAAIRQLLVDSRRLGHSATHRDRGRWLAYVEPIRSPALAFDDIQEPLRSAPETALRGYALVEVSIDTVFSELLKFSLAVLSILITVIVTAWFVVGRFSARIDNSLRSVAQAAQEIGSGVAGVRLQPDGIGIFDNLAQSLNRMAGQLEVSQRELERRITLATAALREQRDAADRANGAKSRFLAAASHDLRQPMHALSLLIAALQQESNPVRRATLVGRLEAGTQALSGLLDSLLDISKLDAGGVKVAAETLALEPVLQRLRDTYQDLAATKGVLLFIRPSKGWSHTDPALLERILGNLLSNAIRYTPQGGTVLLAVRPGQARWRIQVRDSGPGIAPADQQLVFQEFIQLHNPRRDRGQGLGLGLAIVQRLTQLLNLSIALRSQPGRGATFELLVPRVASSQPGEVHLPPAGATVLAEQGPGALPNFKGLRILMVEDDTLVRESFVSLLRLWGCEVRAFAGPAAALRQFHKPGFLAQLLICDHRLGGDMNGLQLIQHVNRILNAPVPAILITGDTEDAQLQHMTEPNIVVLFKPVRPNLLSQHIGRLVYSAVSA